MKQSNYLLLRVAALLSSVLLGFVFVAYRSGAFSGVTETRSRPVDSESAPPDSGTRSRADKTLFYSSKTGAIVLPGAVIESPSPDTTKPTPTIMGGPKSAPVFVSPSLQWAVPNSPRFGPPIATQPPVPTKAP